MKTRIAAVIILIYGILAIILIQKGLSASAEHCFFIPIPPYATPSLLIASPLLLIVTCILLTKLTKVIWWSCLIIALINLGIMCWNAIFYLSSHCDGPNLIPPDTGRAAITIIAAIIITLSLILLLSDIKRIHRIAAAGNLNTQNASHSRAIIVGIVVFFIILFIMMFVVLSVGGTFCSSKQSDYNVTRAEIQNAVVQYIVDSNNSSQLPVINENATFTLTNLNSAYYIINMSLLLESNEGFIRETPEGCIDLLGPDNDNCDGGAVGCSNTSHYIWGMDNLGNVVSKFVNSSDMNICQCNTCDGYQGVWP